MNASALEPDELDEDLEELLLRLVLNELLEPLLDFELLEERFELPEPVLPLLDRFELVVLEELVARRDEPLPVPEVT
ncbi:hypothetical protein JW905_04400 [bacterium]|nr:hypothetical protein [candidate division CSSED10-310 bacterium]